MIGFTYPQLLQAMQDWPENVGENYLSNIPRCIEMGELRLVRDLNLEIFDVIDTLYLAAGANTLLKPPELISLRTMRSGPPSAFVAGDPSIALVSLLLHMDGPIGSTTFLDSGPLGLTITANGASISDSSPRFGQGAGAFFGTTSLQGPAFSGAGPLDPRGADFTYEFWFNPAAAFNGTLLSLGTVGTDGLSLQANSNGTVTATFITTSSGTISINSGSGLYAANAWNHVALVCFAGALSIYVNGIYSGTPTTPGSPLAAPTATLYLGAGLIGQMDEFRFTKGLGRYGANFTPPQSAFATSTSPLVGAGKTSPVYKRAYDYLRNFANNPAVTGPPRYYAEQDNATWLLSAFADQTYGVVVHYLMRPLSVVLLGSSWLADRCGDLLLVASLMEAENFLKADDRFGDLEQEYNSKIQIAKVELRNSIRQGDYAPMLPAAAPL